ncbi:E3 ubiquitin-protein ligase TRIM21-like isoform X1 [Sebastes umbrosus]|uniref:E3 ubiquitin-protein ligase TRIM21-like isoform X1 n=2 Tax=Sebastes umbrosus TaxID=72105 RepID=UPI00189C894B|nr:E3 ubiquitin-protein ligase TRIM21-like isoform X1 [Sebastes umbrosus]
MQDFSGVFSQCGISTFTSVKGLNTSSTTPCWRRATERWSNTERGELQRHISWYESESLSERQQSCSRDKSLCFSLKKHSTESSSFLSTTQQNLCQTLSVDMSAASCLLTEDQFLCSICLDVFTDPVAIPCGYNFCKTCITQHWDINVPFQCPNCKEVFNTKPELRVNTFISEMAAQFRQSAQQKASSSSSEQQAAKPGEVPCDVCTGTKLKALKSCLVCLVSYCETHLEPHLTRSGLKRHQLIDPVENLEGRMCTKHDKLLELFCKTDQMCVCMLCTYSDHKTHDVVPLKEEYEGKKAELGKTEAEIQQMIQKRRLKIQEMKHSVGLSKENADREIADGVQVFTALKESVERSQAELIDSIKEKQRKTEKQAEGFIKELEQEISELKKRSTEVEQLSRSEDHLHLLQSFTFLNAAPPTKNWTEVEVCPPSYEGTVVRAVNQLEETLIQQMKKLLAEAELKRVQLKKVQQSSVDVTLDPDTAYPKLILSNDGKQIKHGDVKKNLPDNPERFDTCPCVLAKQSFSSGRFYYEVQVKGKTTWDLGVARESINRKGRIELSPEDGYWTMCLRNEKEYNVCTNPSVCLSLKSQPEKVGVFVDYEEGLVSFYDVDAAALIYSFTGCCFTEKLYPFLGPSPNCGGKNSAPLIISPVNHTE